MNFQPKTEQEIAESKLWAKGEYPFEIVDGFDKNSKTSGKPMIELKVRLSNGKGAARTITDYLLEETPEKLRHASKACGLMDRYNAGTVIGKDFRGKRGNLKLGIEKGKKGYFDKNVVLDYVCEREVATNSGGPLSFT
jgi:hypothetical protein